MFPHEDPCSRTMGSPCAERQRGEINPFHPCLRHQRWASQRRSPSSFVSCANTIWAFAVSCEPPPLLLDSMSVSETMKAKGVDLQMLYYRMSMQCLAATGEIVAGFALLARVEASGMLSTVGGDMSYPIFRVLVEACRTVSHSEGPSRVQATMEQLGSIALAAAAAAPVSKKKM